MELHFKKRKFSTPNNNNNKQYENMIKIQKIKRLPPAPTISKKNIIKKKTKQTMKK